MFASVLHRFHKVALLLSAHAMLMSCARASEWLNFRIDAVATVDGHRASGSTIWHTRAIDTSGSGARLEVTGGALAIPVTKDRFVYGLFRELDGDQLHEWDTLVTGMVAFASDEERRRGNSHFDARSYSETLERTADRLLGREIPICLADGSGLAGQRRCMVFVYVGDPRNPSSIRMIRPRENVVLDGHSFRIEQVTTTFAKAGVGSGPGEMNLPAFTHDGKRRFFGRLGEDVEPPFARELRRSDFRREGK